MRATTTRVYADGVLNTLDCQRLGARDLEAVVFGLDARRDDGDVVPLIRDRGRSRTATDAAGDRDLRRRGDLLWRLLLGPAAGVAAAIILRLDALRRAHQELLGVAAAAVLIGVAVAARLRLSGLRFDIEIWQFN